MADETAEAAMLSSAAALEIFPRRNAEVKYSTVFSVSALYTSDYKMQIIL